MNGVTIFANPGTDCNRWMSVEPRQSPTFSLYPNPNNGILNIRAAEPFPAAIHVTVCNMLGQTMLQQKIIPSGTHTGHLVHALPKGMYVASVLSDQGPVGQQVFVVE